MVWCIQLKVVEKSGRIVANSVWTADKRDLPAFFTHNGGIDVQGNLSSTKIS